MSGRTGRRSHATEEDHRQQMLRMLDDRDIVRRAELDRFSRVLRNDDDVDVDSPCPIFDTWYKEGADAVSRLTNYTPRELNVLWSIVRLHVTRYWNVGRRRRTQFAGKNVLFMTLAVFKCGGTWDMNAHVFRIKAPTFIKTITSFCRVLAPRVYDEWMRGKAVETNMRRLVTSGNTFSHYPCALYATDVTFQQANRPAGNTTEVMPYYSAKHKLYGLKVEVSVNPKGFAINCSQHERGNTPDISIFRNNMEFHWSMRVKSETDNQIPDEGPLREEFSREWAILTDKGYQGLEAHLRCIHPTKGSNLPPEVQHQNENISSDRVLVDNFFGRLCSLWRIVTDKYRSIEDLYDDIFQVCESLTNFQSNPLRDANGEAYAQRENRLRAIGNTIKTKRRLSQDKYRSRKRLRHRMTLDDLPGHDDLICGSDDTQLPGY
ncbi:hypothetical protein F441_18848 [Phytophthora nicotianae CJ01A1]|uniref:DDE Tnp4 domain-containing protein n=1 Tax=Phytophthora nicotianae CJ01A1 TaxID=1317063 RepID=W2W312_PHYNI|nr:hypothetical protein F441_18848 [Phytophthora nicotianae CJ01A1]